MEHRSITERVCWTILMTSPEIQKTSNAALAPTPSSIQELGLLQPISRNPGLPRDKKKGKGKKRGSSNQDWRPLASAAMGEEHLLNWKR